LFTQLRRVCESELPRDRGDRPRQLNHHFRSLILVLRCE
jgi:hypothetical protein